MSNYETYQLINSLDSESTTTSSFSFSTPMYIKFQAMFWVFAEALIILLLGLRCIEKGNKISKYLAVIGLGFGLCSVILQLAAIWEIIPLLESSGFFSVSLSTMGKITTFVADTTFFAIIGALAMRIKANDKTVSILKLVMACCGLGLWLITVMAIFGLIDSLEAMKIISLGSILLSCFVVSWLSALIISRFNRKDKEGDEIAGKDEKEMIIEKVEIKPDEGGFVEAEAVESDLAGVKVTESEAVEGAKVEREEMPPLQSDDMAPTVKHESELNIESPNNLN